MTGNTFERKQHDVPPYSDRPYPRLLEPARQSRDAPEVFTPAPAFVDAMNTATTPSSGISGTTGSLNYLAASVKSSLYRNSEVLTRRDRDGSDDAFTGVLLEKLDIPINNARLLESTQHRTLERHGFELLPRPLGRSDLNFYDHQQVVREYYGECATVIREATGAAHVCAFDHNLRSASGKKKKRRIAGGQQVQGPARMVHGDYTLTSAPQRLQDLTKPAGSNDTLRSILGADETLLESEMVNQLLQNDDRFAIINLWRSIAFEPVATHPLALCDGQTVNPEDLVVFEIHYQDRIGENYFAKHAPQHTWWYYPAMTRDEALLIKQWDSAGGLARSGGTRPDSGVDDQKTPCTFSFHTAFRDPDTTPESPDRQSIEVRCVVVYD